jgi:DNA-binding response OmpR family regulator
MLILIVDRDRDAANTLASAFRDLGFEAQIAHDGATALEMARSKIPDAILADTTLLGMNEHELAKRFSARTGSGLVQC